MENQQTTEALKNLGTDLKALRDGLLKSYRDLAQPIRTKVKIGAAVSAGIFFILLIRGCTGSSSPAYVVSILDRVNTPADVERYNKYFTPQGKSLVLWMMSQQTSNPSLSTKAIISETSINGNVCDISPSYSNSSVICRLIYSERWQFHDMYINSYQGKQVDVWASDLKDHPYRVWWSANGPNILGEFLKGFAAGMAGGG